MPKGRSTSRTKRNPTERKPPEETSQIAYRVTQEVIKRSE
jgi:hypothetical protein